ncbi:MAG TPA: NAD-dependent epimerase/dehydratase family protein [Casimicrobiaceae bacterium]|nr:NAD-dependent epimerase/dehydratase family protein [Casimicrobiaceae bacterium]
MTQAKRSFVAVTGAGGFIGRALCARLQEHGQPVRRLVRASRGDEADEVAIDLERAQPEALARVLDGAMAVVHLAARVHRMEDSGADAEAAHRLVNVDVTERLALAAVTAGVRRFVFASTVKVNGETTPRGRAFRAGDAPSPQDAYARSKLAAERTLAQVSSGTSMLATTLRLPLVYGAGAGGNFRRLVDAVAARRFLPFGAIDNRRSVLGLDNLLDAIEAVLASDNAVIGAHFVADAQSVSTPALVRAIADALGVEPRLLSVPVGALKLGGALAGRSATIARLVGSLEVDASALARATAWQPRPFRIDTAMVQRVPAYN